MKMKFCPIKIVSAMNFSQMKIGVARENEVLSNENRKRK